MALELTILVGTMTGTAQLVAQELELTLDDGETRVRVRPMDGLDAGVFSGGGLFLICSSTYGQGDVPTTRRTCTSLSKVRVPTSRRAIRRDRARRPDLRRNILQRRQTLRRDPSELGARRIGEIMLHDASAGTMPEEVAVAWIAGWIRNVAARLAA